MKKILVFLPYYKPSIKSGGPVKSIYNLVSQLSDEFKFYIVTSDRDIGDKKPYKNIKINEWTAFEGAEVLYINKKDLTFYKIYKILKEDCYDALYLNSFFSIEFSIKPVTVLRFMYFHDIPIVLAARGEFSAGALALKKVKKKAFIWFSEKIDLHRKVMWHASTLLEKNDIMLVKNVSTESILIARNLPTPISKIKGFPGSNTERKERVLRIIFLSRISPKKNLDYALNILKNIKSKVVFDIFGPIESSTYWNLCLKVINKMPINVTVNYCGSIDPDEVGGIFSSYDLFFFPTLGENYGHVIAESLSVGTKVLISDQTPWRSLERDNLGWDFPLSDKQKFSCTIESLSEQYNFKSDNSRKEIANVAYGRIFNSKDISDNKSLFLHTVASN
jgi:glycosyltransferase involved in cell wall biosynthesis